MTTKVEQTSQHHQPFKSLSDTDLTIVSTGDVTGSDKKRVTIKDASFDSCTTDSMSSEQAKSKTLPAKTKLALTLKRTNSLKRSITLPRNPFIGIAKKSKPSTMKEGIHFEEAKSLQSASTPTNPDGNQSPSRSNRNSKPTSSESVRNFFNRVVSQMSASSLSRTLSRNGGSGSGLRNGKCDYTEEQIAEWKRRFAAESGGKVPGVIGIRNHGNTCFINAILQCLSYTDLLAEYFVLDQVCPFVDVEGTKEVKRMINLLAITVNLYHEIDADPSGSGSKTDRYKSDLKRKRRLHALSALQKGASSKGEVTEQLACVLKSLWSLQYDPEISIRFKSLVEKHASQFKGNNQHDAQEFLLWLLDRVHEDLNVATKRRYKSYGGRNSNGNSETFSDEVLAAEALANYIRHNRSFIMDVFQAQFHSSLTCPTCRRQSKTFDPFLCISLPIPQKQLVPVYVTVVYIDQTPRQVKLGLTVGAHETVGDLRKVLSKDTGISIDQLLLTEVDDLTFKRTFYDFQSVSVLKSDNKKDSLYCIELPQHKAASDGDGAFIMLTWINVFKEGPIERRFGSPYTIQVSRETLYSDLQKLLLKEMASILHDDILIGSQKVPLFKMRIIDGFDEPSYLDSSVDLPMYTLAIEQAINMCTLGEDDSKTSSSTSSGVPLHVKLVLEWDMPAKSQVINDDTDQIEEHASVKQVAKSPEEATSVTLQECFSLYTRAEKLGHGEAWFCPACNRKQEVVTQMVLWTAPDVLIINLKRFRQSSPSASTCNKLSTAVEFPLEGFDMTPNMTHRNSSDDVQTTPESVPTAANVDCSTTSTSNGLKMWNTFSASWRKSERRSNRMNSSPLPQLPQDSTSPPSGGGNNNYIYDLYAVCNHHGSDLQSGHYTATCKNPTDGQWYHFDDVNTRVVDRRDVISVDAYILFYQRRQVQNESSSSSSSSSGSSGADGCHWVYRMPEFNFKKSTVSKTIEKDDKEKKSNGSSPTKSNFVRNAAGKYATMPTKRSCEPINCDTGHHSDGEHEGEEDLSSDEEDLDEKIMTSSVTQHKLAPLVTTESNDDDDDEDVSKPIDKDDVD